MKIALNTTLALALTLSVNSGCHRSAPRPPPAPPAYPAVATVAANGRVDVVVDGDGYHPGTINASPGSSITLVFNRITDETCGQHVRFPTLNLDRELPLRQPVEIPIMVPATGRLGFTCGMGMYLGSIVAR